MQFNIGIVEKVQETSPATGMNNTVEPCSSVAGSMSVLCNINAESITLHEALHDGIVPLMWDYRLIYG